MTITKHPDISTLLTCSAGSQPEVLCAVVTSHLAMCPECMAELERMELIGVALFDELKPDNVSIAMPDLSAPAGETKSAEPAMIGEVPHPLAKVIGNDLDTLDWQRLDAGLMSFEVPLTKNAKGDLRLLQLDGRAELTIRSHDGERLLVVLRGSFINDSETFLKGDFADTDDRADYAVTAGPSGCIILVANESTPEFISE